MLFFINYVTHLVFCICIITGVKVHGEGIHLFPSFNIVHKGANLTIHIIDKVIDNWVKDHGYYPSKIYLQVDGESENANQFVMHHLEHLVSKKVAREILYTCSLTYRGQSAILACYIDSIVIDTLD